MTRVSALRHVSALACVVSVVVMFSACRRQVELYGPLPEDLNKILGTYAAIRGEQTRGMAEHYHVPLGREFRKFFESACAGDWGRANRRYERFRYKSGQWGDKGERDPGIANVLWEPVHEVGWAYREFATWDAESLRLFAGQILSSLPDGSIFFGGTDAGRFVISAFQAAEKKPRIFVITQNNLANPRYLQYLRYLYGDSLWIPGEEEVAAIFAEHAAGRGLRNRRNAQTGPVRLDTSEEIMAFSSVMVRRIVEKNIDKHSVYVEESFVIPWMYSRLEPHGLIMKLNSSVVSITPGVIRKDMHAWKQCMDRLLKSDGFLGNGPARKAFAKLRCGIAGIYAARNMPKPAEMAFLQARQLDPTSPEAALRLVQEVLIRKDSFQEARALLAATMVPTGDTEADAILDKNIHAVLALVERREEAMRRVNALEAEMKEGKIGIDHTFELMVLYRKLGKKDLYDKVSENIMNQKGFPPVVHYRHAKELSEAGALKRMSQALDKCLSDPEADDVPVEALLDIARMYAQRPDYERLAGVLERYLKKKPDDYKAWMDLAISCIKLKKEDGVISALRKAVEAGKEPARQIILADKRLAVFREKLGL